MAHYEYEDILEDSGKLICVLCKVVLPDDSFHIEAHINDENHKGLYFHRLLKRNSMVLNGNDVHCSICNNTQIELFESVQHIDKQSHKEVMKKIKNIVDKDGAFIEFPESDTENKLNCLICNREILFTLEELETHVSHPIHKRARAIAVQPFNGIVSVEGSDKDLWCKICNCYICNYIETIFDHVDNNKDHVTYLSKLLWLIEGQNITIEKFLANAREDKALCNKCNREVSCNVDNLERHIRGTLHLKSG